MSQLAQIQKCFGQLYCKVQSLQCIGRNSSKEELLLKKLYIAYWISCGRDCDIDCFLMANCAHCKPTKNSLPPVAPSPPPCCGLNRYAYFTSMDVGTTLVSYSGIDSALNISLSDLVYESQSSSDLEKAVFTITDLISGNDIVLYSSPIPSSIIFTIDGSVKGDIITSVYTVGVQKLFSDSAFCGRIIEFTVEYDTSNGEYTVSKSEIGYVQVEKSCDGAVILSDDVIHYVRVSDSGVDDQAVGLDINSSDYQLVGLSAAIGSDVMDFSTYWANCNDSFFASIPKVGSSCRDSSISLDIILIGLSQTDYVSFEMEYNGNAIILGTEGPFPFVIPFDSTDFVWDKEAVPPGSTVKIIMRSNEKGVIFETSKQLDSNC